MSSVLRVNFSKILIEMRRYLPDTIGQLITFYAVFLMLFLGIQAFGDPITADANIQYVIVSNAFWMLLIASFIVMASEVSNEAIRGTLEQLYMSPVPAWQIMLARGVSNVLIWLVLVIIVVILAMLTSGQWLTFSVPAALLLGVPTIAAVLGLGFIGAGLALVFKQIGSILQIGQFFLMAMAFAPVSLVPGLEFLPAMKGIDLVRNIAVGDMNLLQVSAMDWWVLGLNGAGWLLIGILVFRWFEQRALQRGILGKY